MIQRPRKLTDLPRIGDTLAARIAAILGHGNEDQALKSIAAEPYNLLKVPRVGFKTADMIATQVYGVPLNSKTRHFFGNHYILGEDGTLPADDFDFQREKNGLTTHRWQRLRVVEEMGRVWRPDVLEAEKNFARWTCGLPLGEEPCIHSTHASSDLLSDLDPWQQRGANLALYGENTHVMALTGGAGTGKTHVIGGICRVAQATNRRVAVAAFAGKAADRIRSSLDRAKARAKYAGTIHRMLGYTGATFTEGSLPYDLIILDEASMIPTMLLWEVARRLTPRQRLLLVGDSGQLPPVGYGQPFRDLLTLGLPEHQLSTNYRSQYVQGIIRTAQAVRHLETLEDAGDDSFSLYVGRDLSDKATALIREISARRALDDWQLLTWKNDDMHAFNLAVQEEVNPDGFPLFSYRPYGMDSEVDVRAGDKVMVRSNAYDLDIFNGQLGIATRTVERTETCTREAKTLEEFAVADKRGMAVKEYTYLDVEVIINDEPKYIPIGEAASLLQLGYAVTVHKAQGSDWEEVVIYQPRNVAFDANRWWYTSITRAKTKCHVLFETNMKGDGGKQLWWGNTHKTVELGPSIFVGRVRKLLIEAGDSAI